MDEIILRVLKGEASPFEEKRLRRWRSEADANERYFRELARIWDLSGAGSEAGTSLEAGEQEADALLQSILLAAEKRQQAEGPGGGGITRGRDRRSRAPGRATPPVRTIALWGTALAAGMAAVAVGLRQTSSSGPVDRSGSPAAATASSVPQTLRLEDGSYVRLAPGSQLDVRFMEGRRRVTLQGRAFFAVAPDRSRPFLVEIEGTEIRVLGTRFEVAEDGEGIRTVVVEGRVSMTSPWGEVEVPAGSVGRALPGETPGAEAVADPRALLDWPGGLLVFHETPLEAVAREVEEHFGLPVRIRDPSAAARRISASFQGEESFREVLETLCVVTSASCSITPDSAIVASISGGGS